MGVPYFLPYLDGTCVGVVNEMRLVILCIGWALLALGVAILCHDLIKWLLSGSLAVIDAGSFWFAVHEGSLKLAEPAIARHVHPFLWHPVMSTILVGPAFVVIGAPGALLVFLARRRDRGVHGELFKG
jgi:hypothetical protein